MNVNEEELARIIDQSLHGPGITEEQTRLFCIEAKKYKFGAVVVNQWLLEVARELLDGSGIKLVSPVAFPFGTSTLDVKMYEVHDSIKRGADELDMVLNIGAIKSGKYKIVEEEMKALREEAAGKVVKVILETGVLEPGQIVTVCSLAKEIEIDYVKTSTGYITPGATIEAVRIMRGAVGDRVRVKAAGGIHTLAQAIAMLEAGADRIGTSHGVEIIEELRAVSSRQSRR
ncbi:MAG: deoxyribose-phosphate aldolase [Candidatus Hadarchaeum sp.]|uniref:deoxyribose-phosphate aldolase n=1 Tax=Candidatus Hadarchaeum sp. TaxID=2883567 RepID=UPI0031726EF5